MEFKNIIDFLAKSNIKADDIYNLVNLAQKMDLSNEDNLRALIKKGCELAGKSMPLEKENELIQMIKEKGISSDLLAFFKG